MIDIISALLTLFAALIAYFVCGIPFGMIFARQSNVDITSTGSGNIGTTNVARSVGKTAAALTLACDAGKGLVCMLLSRFIFELELGASAEGMTLSGSYGWMLTMVFFACIMGHVFSPYLGFKGGKGIAVGFGATLGLAWPLGLGILLVFLLFALPSRYVSLGSVAAAVSLPIFAAFVTHARPPVIVILTCAVVIVIWSHRENIVRLIRGQERKFSFGNAQKSLSTAHEKSRSPQARATKRQAIPAQSERHTQVNTESSQRGSRKGSTPLVNRSRRQ